VGLTVRGGQEGNWTSRRWSGNNGGGGGGGGGGGVVVTTAAVSVEPPPVPKQQKRSQYEIETFTGWLLRQEQIGVIDAELTIVLSSISVACKQIASLVQRAGISNLTGLQGASNIQGEDQKKLDVISNEVLSLSLSLLWLDKIQPNSLNNIFLLFSSSSLLCQQTLQENVVFLTQKATSHDTCMCEVAFCGFIYYNVRYVMSIVAYITSKLQFDIKLWHKLQVMAYIMFV
jgi:hypothetical protein